MHSLVGYFTLGEDVFVVNFSKYIGFNNYLMEL